MSKTGAFLYNFKNLIDQKISNLEERIITIDEIKWYYFINKKFSEKKRTVVLLHGIVAMKEHWLDLIKNLSNSDYNFLIPDIPPFGKSDKLQNVDYSISKQVDRLYKFITNLNIDKIDIVGNSMGGAIAAHFSVKYSKIVNTLTLLSPFGIYSGEVSPFLQELENGDKNRMIVNNRKEFKYLIKTIFHKPPFIPYPVQKYFIKNYEKNMVVNQLVFTQLEKEIYSLEDEMDKIDIPVLTIWGDKDQVFHYGGGDILKKGIKDIKVEIVPNVGHVPMMERPKYVAKILKKFLSDN